MIRNKMILTLIGIVFGVLSSLSSWALDIRSGGGDICSNPNIAGCMLEDFLSVNGTTGQIGQYGWKLSSQPAGGTYFQFPAVGGSLFGMGGIQADGVNLNQIVTLHLGQPIVDFTVWPNITFQAAGEIDVGGATGNQGRMRIGWTNNSVFTSWTTNTGIYIEMDSSIDLNYYCVTHGAGTTRNLIKAWDPNAPTESWVINKVNVNNYQCCVSGVCTNNTTNIPASTTYQPFFQAQNITSLYT
ncbi:MAG: hypothetical protein KGL39_39520, partial [Patescibacteria group bacterium]|nr:hypothetical protein [Patescibacteria group bacterium]